MSIPSGMIVQRYSEKKCIAAAWLLSFIGALIFSLHPSFGVFLASLFLIGCGMSLLQVVLFPLLRVTGGEPDFAFNSVIVQLVFGAASFVSPFVYSSLVQRLNMGGSNSFIQWLSVVTPRDMSWVSMYWLFTVISLLMTVIVVISPIPPASRSDDEVVGPWRIHADLLKNKVVILFFFGIFSYVGVEQGISNWISEFLRTYHHLRPETEGSRTVGLFWGMMTIGCIPGLLLLKVMDSRVVLRLFSLSALVILLFSIFGNSQVAQIGFPALGFCLSVMYGIIFSLALNSVQRHHGSFSGILCTGIAGGALISLFVGQLADLINLRVGLCVLFFPLFYILTISFWARPLVNNARVNAPGTGRTME